MGLTKTQNYLYYFLLLLFQFSVFPITYKGLHWKVANLTLHEASKIEFNAQLKKFACGNDPAECQFGPTKAQLALTTKA